MQRKEKRGKRKEKTEKRRTTRGTKRFFPFLFALCSFLSATNSPALEGPSPPEPRAKAWLLVDYDSGQILAAHEADAPLPPASLAKLMTAYVLFEKLKASSFRLTDNVTVSTNAARVKGAKLFLRAGEAVPAEILLQGMIVHSANDAAVALAEHAAGSESAFVADMNAAAQRLGLTRSRFINVTGHDEEGQQASARDIARLAATLIQAFPNQYGRFAARSIAFGGIRQYNRNALLWRDPSVDGIKSGQTHAAGYCLLASARRNGMRLIAVVLGAQDETGRTDGVQQLLDYGFRNFETRLAYRAQTRLGKVRVWFGETAQVALGPQRDIYVTIPHGASGRIKTVLEVTDRPAAPVRAGQTAGKVVIELDGRQLSETPLVALGDVALGNALQRTLDRLQWWAPKPSN